MSRTCKRVRLHWPPMMRISWLVRSGVALLTGFAIGPELNGPQRVGEIYGAAPRITVAIRVGCNTRANAVRTSAAVTFCTCSVQVSR